MSKSNNKELNQMRIVVTEENNSSAYRYFNDNEKFYSEHFLPPDTWTGVCVSGGKKR